MSDKRTFLNRDRGCADLVIFGPFILLFCLLVGSCGSTTVSAASFSTDGVIVSSTVTESRMVTIAADNTVSYDLSIELTFDLDDADDTASVSGFAIQNMPDLPPITRTEMITAFIPGDFPDPGHLAELTTITTVDIDAAPRTVFGSREFRYPIRENTNGFFFDYLFEARVPITGLLTQSVSVDGGTPTIESDPFTDHVMAGGVNSPPIRILINPDLTLAIESGSFFAGSSVGGIPFTIVVPEPGAVAWLVLIPLALSRRLRSTRLKGGQ